MSLFSLWLGVMFPLVFSPGPANIVFAVSGAQMGVRRSLPLLAGVDTVFILVSILVGFGFGQVMQRYPDVVQVMQWLGAAYLIYLAWTFLRSSLRVADTQAKPLGFVDGVVIQVLNSKGWLMVVLMYSLFSEPALEQFGALGIWVLVVWLAVLNISIHLVWIKAGHIISQWSQHPGHQRWQSAFYAACLLLVAIWLLLDSRLA
ncbi:threonine transporter [Bacterioplanes sanyensis]|uniref:Threonine transporter n=1 Tax=Bacterioplanes sanyensis TaxID=1249553 RepID=A0A222FNQ5_9GAMM|nr:LysE family translocator [Bacterioplanes sanyensis]ASP40176.1 threonine transporter [Bacterioplanes sanyensis]